MLEISSETESRLNEYAAAEGLNPDEAVRRLLEGASSRRPPDPKALALAQTIRQWQAEDATKDEKELIQRDKDRLGLEASLNEAREQSGMRLLFPGQE